VTAAVKEVGLATKGTKNTKDRRKGNEDEHKQDYNGCSCCCDGGGGVWCASGDFGIIGVKNDESAGLHRRGDGVRQEADA